MLTSFMWALFPMQSPRSGMHWSSSWFPHKFKYFKREKTGSSVNFDFLRRFPNNSIAPRDVIWLWSKLFAIQINYIKKRKNKWDSKKKTNFKSVILAAIASTCFNKSFIMLSVILRSFFWFQLYWKPKEHRRILRKIKMLKQTMN